VLKKMCLMSNTDICESLIQWRLWGLCEQDRLGLFLGTTSAGSQGGHGKRGPDMLYRTAAVTTLSIAGSLKVVQVARTKVTKQCQQFKLL